MDRISKALDQAHQGVVVKRLNTEFEFNRQTHSSANSKMRSVALSQKLLEENRIFASSDASPIVDTYGLLRTRVLKKMKQNKWKTLGITSPNPSVGKTTTAINLAISIALDHNYSTLLVDTDLRRPSIAKTLGMQIEVGLNDYLTGNETIEDVLVNPEIDHVVIVPTNRVMSRSSELLSSPKMRHFISDARRRYPERLVIFDLPPVLVGDDVVALTPHLDAVLLIVEDNKTQDKELMRTLELLQDASILGIVLNKGKVEVNQYDYY